MEIIDRFLPINEFRQIQQVFFSHDITWQFAETKTRGLIDTELGIYNYQYVHKVYNNYRPVSKHFDDLNPVLDKIKPFAIDRIKVNAQTRMDKTIEYALHVDNKNHKGKTGILYLNTCDGYTVFESGKKVESIENRMLIFDGRMLHAGSSVTDCRRRLVVNFNWA